jgi:hypothetical protein
MTLAQFYATHRKANAIVVPGRAELASPESLFRIPGILDSGHPLLGILIDAERSKKK